MNNLRIIFSFLMLPGIVTAGSPQFKSFNTQEQLEKGKALGISINALGQLSLAPALDEVSKTTIPHFWCASSSSEGATIVAGGNPAIVLKIGKNQKIDTLFAGQELSVFALLEQQGKLYFATSPDGKVYVKRPNEAPAEFFKPEAKYIWAMALAEDNLYVATGEPARIYRVAPNGTATTFFESEEQHIRSLCWDGLGQALYAGSGGNGYLYRLERGGRVAVLYDAAMSEVNQIVVSKNGQVYFSAASDGVPTGLMPPVAEAPNEIPPEGEEEGIIVITAEASDSPVTAPVLQVPPGQGSRGTVYKFEGNGYAKTLWASRTERAHALCIVETSGTRTTQLLVGTGNNGKLYRLDEDGTRTLLLQSEATQITALTPTTTGSIALITANSGGAYLLGRHTRKSGEYESEVIDAGIAARWGALSWQQNDGGNARFLTRSGNTSTPDKTWSDWSTVEMKPAVGAIKSPASRFLQWKLVLEGEQAPVQQVKLSYLQENIAPEILAVTIFQPGESFPDASKNAANHSGAQENGVATNGGSTASPGRLTRKQGMQSLGWQGVDENGDQLEYEVAIKSATESSWRQLVKEYTGRIYSFDSRSLPDGEHQVRVTVSDRRSNPLGLEKTGEKLSELFVIDNTPPVVEQLRLTNSGKLVAGFVARDALSPIKESHYAIDAGDWQLIYPADHVADQREERFEISLPDDSAGKYLAIRVTDIYGNTGFGKIVISQ